MSQFARITFSALILSALCITGCSKSPDQLVIGRWKGRIELNETEIKNALEAAKGNDLQTQQLEDQFAAMKSTEILVEFKPNGEMTTTGKVNNLEQTASSKWTAKNTEGKKVQIDSIAPDSTKPDSMMLTFENNDQFVTEAPGQNKLIGVIRFRRLR